MSEQQEVQEFRLAYVPGVMPAKWVRIWEERIADVPLELMSLNTEDSVHAIRSKSADAALVRLPIDREDLHAISLYTETTVVILPKEHPLGEAAELTFADLDGELILHPEDDPLLWDAPLPGDAALARPTTTKDAVELVLAEIGLVIVPQSMARLHHDKELIFRPLAEAPTSEVALIWREDSESELMEDLIGIVRGRTANSSRGKAAEPKQRATAKAKAAAKAAKAEAAKPAASRAKASTSTPSAGKAKAKPKANHPSKAGRPNGNKRSGGGKSGGGRRGR